MDCFSGWIFLQFCFPWILIVVCISVYGKTFNSYMVIWFFFAGGLWLGTLLYIWQFPHFKALSWNIRADYQRAGYMMTSVTHPDMCKRVAFRHTVIMTLACCLGPAVGCTTEMFILYSLPCNLWGVYLGYKFYSDGDSKSSRALFRFSLVQMPYLILMMIISKKWQSDKTKLSESEILNKAVTWTKLTNGESEKSRCLWLRLRDLVEVDKLLLKSSHCYPQSVCHFNASLYLWSSYDHVKCHFVCVFAISNVSMNALYN